MTTSETLTDHQHEEELKRAEAEFAATLAHVQSLGVKLPDSLLDMSDWLTIKRYARQHNLRSQVITNWISRSIIPADCVRTVVELNDLRLVKDRSYR